MIIFAPDEADGDIYDGGAGAGGMEYDSMGDFPICCVIFAENPDDASEMWKKCCIFAS